MSNITISLASDKSTEKVNFRHDINLLRGLAILSVVFYHFVPKLLPGGFIGVDIFFVISGYLMTSIITKNAIKGDFSFISFYSARFRRIVPALFVMTIMLMLAFWYWLPTVEYRKLGNYVGYVVLFISNIRLNKESGDYFAGDSHENWFLHTWSLSVEWQFYLLLPLLIVFLVKIKKAKSLPYVFLALAVLSFSSSVYHSSEFDSSTFYLLQYRAWEMLCGGLSFFLTAKMSSTVRNFGAATGLVAIILCAFLLDQNVTWPGIFTVIPVASTMLCIICNSQTLASQLDRHISWVGLSSYSVYLWHWPLAVLLVYANVNNDVRWVSLALIASFIIGVLSWKTIENPARSALARISNLSLLTVAVVFAGSLYLTSYAIKNQIVTNDPNPRVDVIASEAINKNYSEDSRTHISHYGSGPVKAIIIGDSHAVATATALASAVGDNGSVVGLTYSGCPNIAFGDLKDHPGCSLFNQQLLNRLSEFNSQTPVFLVNRSTHYIENGLIDFGSRTDSKEKNDELFKESYSEMVCAIRKRHNVFMVNPIPEMPVNVPRRISHDLMMGKTPEDIFTTVQSYIERNQLILDAQKKAAKSCSAEILKPIDYLCHDGLCYGSENLQPLYFDDNHISETGNKKLIPMFKSALK